ncbi:MAG TPA: hypothetical protein PLS10_08950 [Chitinophagales bacterium]|nr:hypothetical protein [Chitinophagales bacterium]
MYARIFFIIAMITAMASCNKEPVSKISPTVSKATARRNLFIPQADWSGSLKSITVYHYMGDSLLYTGYNQYYYSNKKITAQCFKNDYATNIDSSILLYNDYVLRFVNINYDTSFYDASKIAITYNYDSITGKLININHQFPSSLFWNISGVIINYSGNNPTGYYIASGNLDDIYIRPVNNIVQTNDADSLSITKDPATGNYIYDTYHYSGINYPDVLSILNTVSFLSSYGFDTYGFIFPYYLTGADNWHPLTKLPAQKITNYSYSSFSYATNYYYHTTGSIVNSIVIDAPVVASRDSLVFSYY